MIGRQKDINSDLDSYLNKKRDKKGSSTSFFSQVENLIPSWSRDENVPSVNELGPTVVEREKKSFWSYFFSNKKSKEELVHEAEMINEAVEPVAEEIEEIEEEIETLEKKEQSLLSRIFSVFRSSSRDDEDEEISQEEIDSVVRATRTEDDEETRAVLKITHKWISRLPPEHIQVFKQSPDFERYKETLRKYDLIR